MTYEKGKIFGLNVNITRKQIGMSSGQMTWKIINQLIVMYGLIRIQWLIMKKEGSLSFHYSSI